VNSTQRDKTTPREAADVWAQYGLGLTPERILKHWLKIKAWRDEWKPKNDNGTTNNGQNKAA